MVTRTLETMALLPTAVRERKMARSLALARSLLATRPVTCEAEILCCGAIFDAHVVARTLETRALLPTLGDSCLCYFDAHVVARTLETMALLPTAVRENDGEVSGTATQSAGHQACDM